MKFFYIKTWNSQWKKREKRFVLILTVRKSKKISPVLQQMLKCFPPDQMQSVQLRKMLYHLCSSCPETGEVSRRTLIAHHTIFSSRRRSSYVLDFLHSNSGCSENSSLHITSSPPHITKSPLHITKARPHKSKTVRVHQLLHRVQIEETDCKNVL